MSDYGHALAFGVFLTPSSRRVEAVVELATLADESGLDLVTFQDHPYQPAFLDTWTLMSYVAARTQTVHLSGNVLNVPLRNPAVLARSAASLDLLSEGRCELGLGAGAFWEAIEAMGGRRLSPDESVDALAEAIDIIRQVWDAGARGGVRVLGNHYRVVGAKPGPAPAHPIGIWVGAYKPRMLRLTGRLADGWLPSLSYLQPGDIGEANALIDQAAHEAGRKPDSIRRLLNISGEFTTSNQGLLHGPVGQWVEELAHLTLANGISTFILGSDDPDAIRTFAAQVAPGVRELVAAGRAEAVTASAGEKRDDRIAEVASGAPRGGIGGAGVSGRTSVEAAEEPLAVEPTLDDGTRLSSRRLWDEASRPARPPSPPDTGYTNAGREASALLVQVHDMLRQELATVRDIIAQVKEGSMQAGQARGQLNEMTMRQNIWTMGAYCESYCRVVTGHHALEDASVFPRLRARERDLSPVLDRLQEEHVAIHEVLDSVDRALVNFIAKPDDFTEVDEVINLLTDTLFSHLAYEERELIEPLARHGF